MAIVSLSWLLATLIGAIPYLFERFSFVDAFFESMSGFTTTGSTIFVTEDYARLSRGLIFWRALTQWLGGLGIIALFVAVLPALAVAGRHMFFAEAPGPEDEALTPRIRHTAKALWRLYAALTAIEVALLHYVGDMGVFDAVCHSFSTLATGGFSPNPRSLEGYGGAAQWICAAFMFLAGTSFTLQYRALRRPRLLLQDTEFRAYVGIVVVAGLLVSLLIAGTPGHDFEASLRHGFFQTVNTLTATGFASEDFNLWSHGSLMVLGLLMFIGGCAGSASGGPKVVRIVILMKFLAREIVRTRHPNVVRVVRLGDRPVPVETMRQVVGFFVAYLVVFAAVAVLVGVLEDDLRVGFTGSIAALGNIGPGFGRIGPMETFAGLGTLSKILLIFNMWVGRLEVLTVLVMFHPEGLRSLLRYGARYGAR
jgi:trk system potassium uptake protein TrkH